MKGLADIGTRDLTQQIAFDVSHRTRDGLTPLGSVTDDDNVVKVCAFLSETDINLILLADNNFFSDVTDIRDYKRRTWFNV